MVIFYIAHSTLRENIRDRVFYNLVLFAMLLLGGALLLSDLAIGGEHKIIIDMGLTCTSLVGVLIAIFIGIGLVTKEIERRTIYSLVSKPVRRWQFLLGKFLGLLTTLAINVAVMSLGILLALLFLIRSWHNEFLLLFPAVLLIYMELVLVTALALFFSTFSTPALSAALTLCLWIAGHFNADLVRFAKLSGSQMMLWVCTALAYLLPNYGHFKMPGGQELLQAAGHFLPWPVPVIAYSVLYGLAYSTLLFFLAVAVFERRDFK